jgi:epsilon-lactone hydrolase
MTDLTVTGSSYAGKAHADPAIGARAISTRAADYLAGADPADPLVSPIFADLSGLPPLLIQAGSHEVLLDEGEAALNRAARFVKDNTALNATR